MVHAVAKVGVRSCPIVLGPLVVDHPTDARLQGVRIQVCGIKLNASSGCWLQSYQSLPSQGQYPCPRFSLASSSFWPRLATALRSWRRLPFGGELALGTPPVHPARTKQVPPVRVVPAGQPPKATPKAQKNVRFDIRNRQKKGFCGSFESGAGKRPTGWAIVGKDHTYTHTPWRSGTRERSRRCRGFRC